MLNFISITKPMNLQYTEMMERFLMNVVAFSVALVSKDYSSFSSDILVMMEDNPSWLEETATWGQNLLAQSVVDGENYRTHEEVAEDLTGMFVLYNVATKRDLTDREEALFYSIHDKFLALLLTDDKLINYLLEEE